MLKSTFKLDALDAVLYPFRLGICIKRLEPLTFRLAAPESDRKGVGTGSQARTKPLELAGMFRLLGEPCCSHQRLWLSPRFQSP